MLRRNISISIHALREEGDLEKLLFCLADRLFLSTPSARRATQSGRPDRDRCVISIHALREEGDVYQASDTSTLSKFLSTPSVRRATSTVARMLAIGGNFYPRPP